MIFVSSRRACCALVFSFAAYVALTHGTARALAEFCPATLSEVHVVAGGDGSLYSATLDALSPRSVQADVEAQTENGWYAFSIPSISISQQSITYKSPLVTFVRNESTSPVFYVRFPSGAGKVLRWWVTDATSSGDTVMGWDAKGKFTCAPQANFAQILSTKGQPVPVATALNASERTVRVTPGAPDYDKMPGVDDAILNARAGAPAQNLACTTPFAFARVTRAISPTWPLGYAARVSVMTLVRVAVDADGNIADAWVWQPSGGGAFDDAAVASAKQSFYAAGTAFCAPAPGSYLFRAQFRPH